MEWRESGNRNDERGIYLKNNKTSLNQRLSINLWHYANAFITGKGYSLIQDSCLHCVITLLCDMSASRLIEMWASWRACCTVPPPHSLSPTLPPSRELVGVAGSGAQPQGPDSCVWSWHGPNGCLIRNAAGAPPQTWPWHGLWLLLHSELGVEVVVEVWGGGNETTLEGGKVTLVHRIQHTCLSGSFSGLSLKLSSFLNFLFFSFSCWQVVDTRVTVALGSPI